jgi:DEAD/DEAH box helicase domain-containing protein
MSLVLLGSFWRLFGRPNQASEPCSCPQVCATNALELGVDVGSLDATLHLGYPGSVASLWQQSGRAGRRISERGSLSVYVGFGGPLDQYFMRDPQRLFGRPIENAQVGFCG